MGRIGLGICGLVLALGACSKGESRGAPGSSGAPAKTASAAAVASDSGASAPSAEPPRATAAKPACRVLRVAGAAKLGDVALEDGALLDGSEWVSLGAGASLSLKHTQSGRELMVAGPAMLRPCRRGREQVLVAKGTVTVGAGMGARPGAEVLLATPVGAARYGDADFTLALDEKALRVTVRAGEVELEGVLPDKPLKSPLRAKDKLQVPLGKPDVQALLSRCQELAQAAEKTALSVADRSSREPLGHRARSNVVARKAARLSCAIAASATGLVADPEARAGYWAEAERWEGLGESIPRQRPSQAPEK